MNAYTISYFQAIVLGLLQGVTELFPVSSLGHTVIFPTLFGWTSVARAQSQAAGQHDEADDVPRVISGA